MSLEGTKALVTGSTSGIGHASPCASQSDGADISTPEGPIALAAAADGRSGEGSVVNTVTEEFAAVSFLASPQSGYFHAGALHVDGGAVGFSHSLGRRPGANR